MNKNSIRNYAVFARKTLLVKVIEKAKALGIERNGKIVDDVTFAREKIISDNMLEARRQLILKIKKEGFDEMMEEVAYTWFNRFTALRFMEVNGCVMGGIRLFSSQNNLFKPEILERTEKLEIEGLNREIVNSFKEKNDEEGLFKYLIITVCNSLSKYLSPLFAPLEKYIELLMPDGLLEKGSVLEKLVTSIPENDFKEQVEIIGWLYQFYISVKKEQVYSSKKTITWDTLPAVTQLFTPEWVVRYMADNSVLRAYQENFKNSKLKEKCKYFVDDEEDGENSLKNNRHMEINCLEDFKILEPCCGSGHILVYVFDLLYKIYLEQGYKSEEIPTLILKNNLFGLDVDKRASQLAVFSLVMKAVSVNPNFFEERYFVRPKVYEICDSQPLYGMCLEESMETLKISKSSREKIRYLANIFENGKTIGALIKIEKFDFDSLVKELEKVRNKGDLLTYIFTHKGIDLIENLISVAKVLCEKYHVMITNPPYIGTIKMEKQVRDYAEKHYPLTKTDMFSMFIEQGFNFVQEGGYTAFMTPYVWMFIKSYEELRKYIIKEKSVETLCQLEYSALEEAIVPLCTFVLKNCPQQKKGKFFRLTSFTGGMEVQKKKFLLANKDKNCGYYYKTYTKGFLSIPGSPIAYWTDDSFENIYKQQNIAHIANVITGMTIGDNQKYLRMWHEVDFDKIALNRTNMKEIDLEKTNFIPYSKGGIRRNWYGNYQYVVNFAKKDKFNRSKTTLKEFYLKRAITWPFVTSGDFSARILPQGFLWDVAGSPCFLKDDKYEKYCLGFMCSSTANYILKVVNPTINVQAVDIQRLPFIKNDEQLDFVNQKVDENIELSKEDWDNYETSWNFKKNPLI